MCWCYSGCKINGISVAHWEEMAQYTECYSTHKVFTHFGGTYSWWFDNNHVQFSMLIGFCKESQFFFLQQFVNLVVLGTVTQALTFFSLGFEVGLAACLYTHTQALHYVLQ